MTKAHVHAENIRLYAEDAAKTDKPWELWEGQTDPCYPEDWNTCIANPAWEEEVSYRRKPRMITVGKHSWPEPMKEAPRDGDLYFVADPTWDKFFHQLKWSRDSLDNIYLARGLVHHTQEAAIQHALALIEISKGNL